MWWHKLELKRKRKRKQKRKQKQKQKRNPKPKPNPKRKRKPNPKPKQWRQRQNQRRKGRKRGSGQGWHMVRRLHRCCEGAGSYKAHFPALSLRDGENLHTILDGVVLHIVQGCILCNNWQLFGLFWEDCKHKNLYVPTSLDVAAAMTGLSKMAQRE